MIVAIDGPAGSGKSTIAALAAKRFGMRKLDTGAMYRSVALCALDEGIDLDDAEALTELAHRMVIAFPPSDGENVRITVNGKDVSEEIRTPRVDAAVSRVAAVPGVRSGMVAQQRRFAENHDVVAEGRDIGTVVFPHADVKVFLTADPAERARRRVLQRHGDNLPDAETLEAEIAKTKAQIEERDAYDSNRAEAPLKAAEDAHLVDSSSQTIDEVLDVIAALVQSVQKDA